MTNSARPTKAEIMDRFKVRKMLVMQQCIASELEISMFVENLGTSPTKEDVETLKRFIAHRKVGFEKVLSDLNVFGEEILKLIESGEWEE